MPKAFSWLKFAPMLELKRSISWSNRYSSYEFSALVVLATLVLIGVGEIVFGSVPLGLFAAAIVTAARFAGLLGAAFSVILSTLACDFFFLPPIWSLDLGQTTWILAAKYGAIALVSYAFFRHRRLRMVVPAASSAIAGYGHLDGVRDGELFGWAIDPVNPETPARVTATVNRRPVAEALAVYYRADVAEQFQCSGRHGFFLDVSQPAGVETDALIDVRLSNGRSVKGAPLYAHIPCRKRAPGPTLLFMHIPKTAGTALRQTILKNYRKSEVAYLYPEPPGFPSPNLRDLPLSQRTQFRLVVGHFQYGIHDDMPNEYWYFTVVRHPVERVWSHYHYLVDSRNAPLVRGAKVKGLEEALEGRVTANLDNLMVRCFAGINEKKFPPGSITAEVYELAKRNLETAFIYVGKQERLDEAYSFLQAKLGWDPTLHPEMKNRGSYSSNEQLDEVTSQVIRHFNTWDIELYYDILKRFP